ncbi:MAG: hypothetical protein MHM6MM_000958 [Cercozoa sp. M6MM]
MAKRRRLSGVSPRSRSRSPARTRAVRPRSEDASPSANATFLKDGWVLTTLILLFFVNVVAYVDRYLLLFFDKLMSLAMPIELSPWLWAVVTGPNFTLPLCIGLILWGFLGDRIPRTQLLIVGLLLLSSCTCLLANVREIWQLLLLRAGIGLSQAAVLPLCVAQLADQFPAQHRGKAMSVFWVGSYFGYAISLSGGYGVGIHFGRKYIFRAAALFGAVAAFLLLLFAIVQRFVLKPRRQRRRRRKRNGRRNSGAQRRNRRRNRRHLETIDEHYALYSEAVPVGEALSYLIHAPALLGLTVAATIRSAATEIWMYYAFDFFVAYRKQPVADVALWLGLAPLGGILGALASGIFSDKRQQSGGLSARVAVAVATQLLAVPLGALALLLEGREALYVTPVVFVFSEAWAPAAVSAFAELSPRRMRASLFSLHAVVVFSGSGLATLLHPSLKAAFDAINAPRTTLLTMLTLFPGLVLVAALVFRLVQNSVRKRGVGEDFLRWQETQSTGATLKEGLLEEDECSARNWSLNDEALALAEEIADDQDYSDVDIDSVEDRLLPHSDSGMIPSVGIVIADADHDINGSAETKCTGSQDSDER